MRSDDLSAYLEACAAPVLAKRGKDTMRCKEWVTATRVELKDASRAFDSSSAITAVLELTANLYEALGQLLDEGSGRFEEQIRQLYATLLSSDPAMRLIEPQNCGPSNHRDMRAR